MQIALQKQRDFIYTLQLDMPWSNQEIVEQLKKETWRPDQAGYSQNSFPTRFRVQNPQQPICQTIQQYVEQGSFKRTLLDTLWATSFPGVWGVDIDRMDRITFIYGIFTKDCPGYSIRIHTDDRMHVLQGMIYFIDDDDPDQSTTTYTTFEGNNPLRIPTGSGVGYFAANTNYSWHTGQNASNQDRYSIIFGIRLNI